ncbi:hypothetical protein C8R44DRAFT_894672 [Mycena epipterygia]|nr:hypothetical protein C8R44DRAFT_894672 [Mycena epipterygia]
MSPKNTKSLNVLAVDSLEYFVGEDGKFPDDSAYIDDSEYMAYSLDLGAGLDTGSACPTPLSPTPRPALRVRTHSTSSSSTSTSYSSSSDASTSYSSSWSASPLSASEEQDEEPWPPYAHSLHTQNNAFPAGALHSLLGARSDDIEREKDAKDGLAAPEEPSDVLGDGNTLFALARAAGCVLVLGVLAVRGQWA